MKKSNIKAVLAASFLMSTLVGCVNGDDYGTPDLSNQCTTLTKTKEVSQIAASATTTPVKYTGKDLIEAYVTSSDMGGNFYKSISFVSTDGSKGFSIPIDDYNLYTQFEPGRKVYINMENRYVALDNDGLVIGSLYNNETPGNLLDDEIGRIAPVEYKSVLTRSCDVISEESLVNRNLTISQIKNDLHLNKLIELDDVQFTDPSLGKTFYDSSLNSIGGATNHEIIDANGGKIVVRVSEFATFANQAIPNGNGKIRGVLTKFGSTYQFMIRTENDVKMTDPRVVPLFEESFSSTTFNNWVKFSVTGTQAWTLESAFGNPVPCAKMTGFSSGTNFANEDWLISPAINMNAITSATLTFDTAARFAGNNLEVFVSTNYSGSGAPSAATWTPLSATLSPNTGNFVWTGSGAIDLSAYTGNNNVRIAFKYTSTTSASTTWEVDNVKVTGQ